MCVFAHTSVNINISCVLKNQSNPFVSLSRPAGEYYDDDDNEDDDVMLVKQGFPLNG